MSKVKLNNTEYVDVQQNIDLAKKEITEAMDDVWSTNFDNLYHNFITNGFLNDLYKDSESKFNLLFGGGTGIICGAGAYLAGSAAAGAASAVTAASVASVIPVVGWIIAGVILAVLAVVGIYHMIKSFSDVQFKHDAEKVFTDLLEECENGTQMNYRATENIETKIENIRLSLQNILFKIDEYNMKYADLNATATEVGVKTTLASDGVTVLTIDTEVTIDGQTVSLSTSEALNAVFTYSNTVMSGEIAADYLSRTYGYEINYNDIVTNANAFMTKTINSGLYSHEFVNALLPEYTPSIDSAYSAITGATGVDLDKIQSALNNNQSVAGSVALFGGLLGTALLGTLGMPNNPGGGTGGTGGTGGGGTGGTGGTGGGSTGGGGGGGTPVVTNPDPVEPDPEEPDPVDPDPEEPDPVDPEPSNDIEIDPIVEIELPDEVEFEINPDGEVDYDELARDKFEFEQDYDELIAHRSEIIEDIERKFDMGDLDSIREELKEYGYSSAEIEMIILDKHKTIKAIVQGDQDAQIAQIARELAKADGIENYESKYAERPNYDDLEGYGPNDRMILTSGDENIVNLKSTMDEAKESYEQSVIEANAALVSAAEAKKVMEELKVKYEAEYGTDTTKWTEEAAKEYSESVKAYNTSATAAEEQVNKMEEEKEKYAQSRKEFKDAKEDFYNKTKEEYENDPTNVLNSNYDEENDIPIYINDSVFPEPTLDITTDGVVIDSSGVTYAEGSEPTGESIPSAQNQEIQSIDEQIMNALTADGNNG